MPTLNDWVWVTAMLVQAMRASITANCRMILLGYHGGAWRLDFFFAADSEEDRILAQHIEEDLSAYLNDIWTELSSAAYAPTGHVVVTGMGPLPLDHGDNVRIVFLRHEHPQE